MPCIVQFRDWRLAHALTNNSGSPRLMLVRETWSQGPWSVGGSTQHQVPQSPPPTLIGNINLPATPGTDIRTLHIQAFVRARVRARARTHTHTHTHTHTCARAHTHTQLIEYFSNVGKLARVRKCVSAGRHSQTSKARSLMFNVGI
jgi:hypothetical protein